MGRAYPKRSKGGARGETLSLSTQRTAWDHHTEPFARLEKTPATFVIYRSCSSLKAFVREHEQTIQRRHHHKSRDCMVGLDLSHPKIRSRSFKHHTVTITACLINGKLQHLSFISVSAQPNLRTHQEQQVKTPLNRKPDV